LTLVSKVLKVPVVGLVEVKIPVLAVGLGFPNNPVLVEDAIPLLLPNNPVLLLVVTVFPNNALLFELGGFGGVEKRPELMGAVEVFPNNPGGLVVGRLGGVEKSPVEGLNRLVGGFEALFEGGIT